METKQRSAQKFCRCGHARALIYYGPPRYPHICGVTACECVKHDTATTPPKAKLKAVEPSPNALARDAAVALLNSTLPILREMCLAGVGFKVTQAILVLRGIS